MTHASHLPYLFSRAPQKPEASGVSHERVRAPLPGAPISTMFLTLAPRRPVYHRPAPERASLVEDLLRGQQGPNALCALPDGHVYLRLKSTSPKYCQIICRLYIEGK